MRILRYKIMTNKKGDAMQYYISFWFAFIPKYAVLWVNGFDAEIAARAPKAYFHTSRGSERR